jgi:hypothetical protein
VSRSTVRNPAPQAHSAAYGANGRSDGWRARAELGQAEQAQVEHRQIRRRQADDGQQHRPWPATAHAAGARHQRREQAGRDEVGQLVVDRPVVADGADGGQRRAGRDHRQRDALAHAQPEQHRAHGGQRADRRERHDARQ